MGVRPCGADMIVIPFVIRGGGDAPVVARMSRMRPRGELFRGGVVGGGGDGPGPVQYAVPVPVPFPMGSVFIPGSRANEDFVHPTMEGFRALRGALGSVLESRPPKVGPPPGSKPVYETPWAGDHNGIKHCLRAKPTDDVRIAPTTRSG